MLLPNGENITFVAEVKTKSPHGFTSIHSFQELLEMALSVGDIISIHTNPLWGGTPGMISKLSNEIDHPILAKGIHRTKADVERCLSLGAKYVLTYDFFDRKFVDQIWYEPSSIDALKKISRRLPEDAKVVWNSRNISTGRVKVESSCSTDIKDIRAIWPNFLCYASNLVNLQQIEAISEHVDAVIVGSYLPQVYLDTLLK